VGRKGERLGEIIFYGHTKKENADLAEKAAKS
jgi:hypothetical protein